MNKWWIPILALFFWSCSNDDKKVEEKEEGFSFSSFSEKFKTSNLPFQLADSALTLSSKDTGNTLGASFNALIADSLKQQAFGKATKISFAPLYKVEAADAEKYFIVKGTAGKKTAAFLVVFHPDNEFGAAFPFLIPDADATTSQTSSIDKAYSISRNVVQKRTNDISAEGKDVYIYSKDAHNFILIMTDPLDEKGVELVNPIDTLAKTNKQAGDYYKGKNNIVSIRDGRKPNMLTVFVHIEKGDCSGEIKGDAEMVNATTAIYRPAGDPCVMRLTFNGPSVKLNEEQGCGSHRGLECLFEGSFLKKKDPKAKLTKLKGLGSKKR